MERDAINATQSSQRMPTTMTRAMNSWLWLQRLAAQCRLDEAGKCFRHFPRVETQIPDPGSRVFL
jgi:hypothetical protein